MIIITLMHCTGDDELPWIASSRFNDWVACGPVCEGSVCGRITGLRQSVTVMNYETQVFTKTSCAIYDTNKSTF